MRWGIAGMLGVVLLLIASGIFYFVSFGVTDYNAELTDAGSLRVGDDVRVAGITVGSVTALTLRPDHVDLHFSVDSDVFVGAQTTLDVRMLTIVGGHYLAVFPAGTEPLGDAPISQDRVTLPYSLPELFQDAVRPVRGIDGEVLRQNFGALQASLDSQPQSVQALLVTVGQLTDVLQRQNADVSRALKIGDEYLNALRENTGTVSKLLDSLNLLETLIEDNLWAFGTLEKTAEVVKGVAPLGRIWQSTLKPMAQPLADSIPKFDEIGNRLGQLHTSVRDLITQLQPFLTPAGAVSVDQSGSTVQAPGLCIPVAGRVC